MKKLFLGILAVALVLSVGATGVFAAGFGKGCRALNTEHVCGYVKTTACRHTDVNGDGICDWCEADCTGLGRYYTDADGDGVCDNAGTGYGTGMGHHGDYAHATGSGYRGGHHR